MSLYYATRPDNINEPNPVFTRYGRLTKSLDTACRAARRSNGKVYATDAGNVRLVLDCYEAPEAPKKLPRKLYLQKRAEAALFGATA